VVIEELPRSGSSSITPKSLDVKRGGNFAIAKIYDAFYGQVDLIVMRFYSK